MMTPTPTDWPGTSRRAPALAALLGLLLLFPAWGAAQSSALRVERLQVDHRDPSTVRDALLEELGAREQIGLVGDWLIVAATDSTRNRIRERLQRIDTPITRMEVTLSFTMSDATRETGQVPGDERPAPVIRTVAVEAGQRVRLNLPDPDGSPESEATVPETGPDGLQLSLQLDTAGRQVQLSHVIHGSGTEADPADGTLQRIDTGVWHALDDGIDIRVRPVD